MEKLIFVPSQEELLAEKVWIEEQIRKVGKKRLENLSRLAATVRLNAYRDYSRYSVGAAVLTWAGNIYLGCNAETATYDGEHAERIAISGAITEGEIRKYEFGRRFIRAIAVSHPGKSGPCGGCRQKIAEHSDNCLIVDVDEDGAIQAISSLKALFPYAFTPSHLGKE